MREFNKRNSFLHNFPCQAFPEFLGATGATGVTPGIMAEIQAGVTGIQSIPSGTLQAINFNLNSKVGDGSILANGIDIVLPEIGTYVVCYTISGDIGGAGVSTAGTVRAQLRQLNTGATFNDIVLGSRAAINLNGNSTPLIPDGDIDNCTLICVSDTGGGNLNNIIRLEGESVGTFGTATGWNVQLNQTSVTITKYSDDVCLPY
ncbi:hypothetical protein [Bacillus wiedmannii]|uniref:hypothetical protein n=1 Tax=Bacillus wiedmannii TaxID=1890302 RepID=UPI000BF3BCAB|nr:hypothetical protein [Bacillus wiedmannii]PFZ93236.1 hypothetical protein COL83_15365 [Bacillus wiedmannii]